MGEPFKTYKERKFGADNYFMFAFAPNNDLFITPTVSQFSTDDVGWWYDFAETMTCTGITGKTFKVAILTDNNLAAFGDAMENLGKTLGSGLLMIMFFITASILFSVALCCLCCCNNATTVVVAGGDGTTVVEA